MPLENALPKKKTRKTVEVEVKQDLLSLLIGTAETLRRTSDMIAKLAAILSAAE